MILARLFFSAFLVLLVPSKAMNSDEEVEQNSLQGLPPELIRNVFLHLGTDQSRLDLGATCPYLRAGYLDQNFPDEEIDSYVKAAIAPGSESFFPMADARSLLQVTDRASRRAFREKQKRKFGSMEVCLSSGYHVGVLNADLFLLLNCLESRGPELGQLNFSGFALKMLPSNSSLWQNLTSIDLSMNEIRELPEAITQIPTLYSLDLMRNNLSRLPKGFHRLTKLNILKLDHNQLTQWPVELGAMSSLRSLSLEGNQITDMSRQIGLLTNLTLLNMSDNKLQYISGQIGNLQHLELLYLDRNQLVSLTESFWKLTSLRHLWLNDNDLFVIPPEISELSRLNQLTVEYNHLLDLPQSLRSLPLDFINFRGNAFLLDNGKYPDWVYQWADEMWEQNRYVGY